MSETLKPRASSRQPIEDAARPLPKLETTPPVTKMYLVMAAFLVQCPTSNVQRPMSNVQSPMPTARSVLESGLVRPARLAQAPYLNNAIRYAILLLTAYCLLSTALSHRKLLPHRRRL